MGLASAYYVDDSGANAGIGIAYEMDRMEFAKVK